MSLGLLPRGVGRQAREIVARGDIDHAFIPFVTRARRKSRSPG